MQYSVVNAVINKFRKNGVVDGQALAKEVILSLLIPQIKSN